jgi:hypothetical protein
LSCTDPSDYDKSLAHIENTTAPGTYAWESPGKPHIVRLSLDVVDRMQQDVMRGFGAVPRRGAEVGGVLIGSVTHESGRPVIQIDDYELVPIEYKRGPSYLLSEEDSAHFAALMERLRAGSDPAYQPVGFFRSHTRETLGLGEEDLQLLDQFLPEPNATVLWIRPYATRVGTAGFLFRENGHFQEGPPVPDFPFRRRELAPGEAPAGRRGVERNQPHPSPISLMQSEVEHAQQVSGDSLPAIEPLEGASDPSASRAKSWFWLPLSFIFLLLGVLLGFQAALSFHPQPPTAAEYFSIGMSAEKSGDEVHVKWNRQAAAIRTAQRGILTIEDGRYSKMLDLDPGQLQNGSVVYRRSSSTVRFRLQLFSGPRDTLTETVEWSEQAPLAPGPQP